ncbi:hypothetical protein [Hungatella effluvii]|uniref:hypothetical protein n=1 Tax=Hungatella effluvii TaxID=1096246 RepID=UPI0022E32048|nr:hypothetical protein [Hungatella effluvii]
MQVCIYAERHKSDFWYKGYTLTLPADQMAMENAKLCARVADGEEYFLELVDQWPDFLYEPLETCSATLQELNFLAQKLSQMSQEEMDTYEGVIQSVPKQTIRNLINATYNLDRFELLLGIMDEEELGEVSIENNLVPVLQNLPDEVYTLLSLKKVGHYVMEQEQGAFTSKGYCCRSMEGWVEPYEGKELPEQTIEDYIFFVHLQVLKTKDDVWLKLPCSERKTRQVLAYLGIHSSKECTITEIRSPLPNFENGFNQDVEVETLNALAFTIYGMECLREGGVNLEAEMFRNFDFESYGRTEWRRNRLHMTPHGAISNETPLEEEPGNGLQMGGMEWRCR